MEKEFRNKIYSKLSKLYEEELSLRNKIYTKLYKLYEEYSDFQVNCGTFSTVVDKKKVISQNKKGQYVKNLKGTLGKVDKIEFVEENSKINYIKRILYKDNESEEGSIRKSYKIENFSEGSILYIATTTVGDQNDITFHDILNAINKKEKGKDEEERRKKFENSFILEKIQTLGKRKEINVTLNTNNNQKIVTKDFNNKFVFNISFYSNNEENNALEEKRFEEAEVQNISMKNSLCLSSMASSSNSQNNINEEKRFEEAEAENIYKDIELEEVKYMNKDNNSLMEEDSDSSQNLKDACLSQRITEEKHMASELPEVQNVSMKDGLCLSSITSSNYSQYNNNIMSSTSYSQNNDNTISSTSYSRNNDNTMSSSSNSQNNNHSMSSSNSQNSNNIEVNEQIGNIINSTQFVGDVFCELNEGIIKIGGIYLENNEYNIKANNNKVIGKIVTFNGTECVITTKIVVCNDYNVIQNNIIGTIVVSREGKSLLSVENNKIGKFYQFGDKRILYLNDMDNLLTQYLIVNTDVLEILNNITNDRITYLRDMNNLITHCLIAQNLMANVHVPVFLNNITNDRITYLKDINNLITHYLIENDNKNV
ncbi:hypothetical protein H8356DRAFT_1316151 [Neocallimastix lanati (nom. inval.)]|uniref:Uncharacterized protein n=1 Tax=Neocallimastix californiae TaxID=1754190 RepID=A0A1Y2C0P0_9FUNG|nr:hypothetical protein H8356DRAFT_1316151 [Neocallimastix sp. JGI-2020a]ORY40613.1 hypothetical protein LY90DRAFT_672190 [Neocallimastix californiae]|eukprot:ORY40613.1 hypothetical protein LY90DRAFT_672190 [Neocallimastix californiae]